MLALVCWPMASPDQQATASRAHWQAREATPGSKTASSRTMRVHGNQGDPIVGAGARAHLLTSLNSEEEGGGDRKSEAPIRAMNSGNAEGAKGRRSGIADNARQRTRRSRGSLQWRGHFSSISPVLPDRNLHSGSSTGERSCAAILWPVLASTRSISTRARSGSANQAPTPRIDV